MVRFDRYIYTHVFKKTILGTSHAHAGMDAVHCAFLEKVYTGLMCIEMMTTVI